MSAVIYVLSVIATIEISYRAVSWTDNYIRSHHTQLIMRDIDISILNRVYKNDTSYFIDIMAGEILPKSRIVKSGLFDIIRDPIVKLLGLSVGFIIMVGMLFNVNMWFALIICVISVIRAGWRFIWQKKVNQVRKQQMQVGARISGIRTDGLTNALTVQLFANEKTETDYLSKKQDEEIHLSWQRGFLDRVRWVPTSMAFLVGYLGVLVLSVYFIRNGQITLADGVFAAGAFTSINQIFFSLSDLLMNLSEKRAEAEKAWNDVIVPIKIADKAGAKKIKIANANLVFDNVTFAYKDKKILKNFCLDIAPRERVGLVGLSGAGKTTIVNLLLRMYDVSTGAIKINGHDIRDVTKESLRKNIAVVPQDISLFNRTIFENIAYARPNAKKSDVIAAAKKAQIHDFIMELPDGYDTLVGNRGIKLSGGQRQRIAIARAILKDAPILIMDEATSALDSASESAIQKALTAVMKDKTVLVIAHRLSTLRAMDRIVVMDRGQLVQVGTHNQLLRKSGIYQKLWRIQKR